jgi:hypothetical protein
LLCSIFKEFRITQVTVSLWQKDYETISISFILETKIEAVERALKTAFNTTIVLNIELLTGRLSSALFYKITVNDQPYVLRVIMKTDAFNNPVRQSTCINLAAEVSIAPQVNYVNAYDAISMIEIAKHDG